jgi:hypothetical protein
VVPYTTVFLTGFVQPECRISEAAMSDSRRSAFDTLRFNPWPFFIWVNSLHAENPLRKSLLVREMSLISAKRALCAFSTALHIRG